jgi:hypothetical protein
MPTKVFLFYVFQSEFNKIFCIYYVNESKPQCSDYIKILMKLLFPNLIRPFELLSKHFHYIDIYLVNDLNI